MNVPFLPRINHKLYADALIKKSPNFLAFHTSLVSLGTDAYANKVKGYALERLTQVYLTTDPTFAVQGTSYARRSRARH